MSALQHRVEVMALRHGSMKHRTILDGISLENHDVIEVVRQDSRGNQARDAASDDEGSSAKATHGSLPGGISN